MNGACSMGGWQNGASNGMGFAPQQQMYGSQQGQTPYQQAPQQQQYQQQPYRGVVTQQSSAPKGPVDVFDFVGSALVNQLQSTQGPQGKELSFYL
jgi:hypothetical protein